MDFGTRVKCHRCTHETYMYYDTHGTGEWGSVAGLCPHCNAMISAYVGEKGGQTVRYPANHPVGVTIIPIPYHEPEVMDDL